jgi:hypothetical protein
VAAPLTARDHRLVRQARARGRWTLALGLALAIAGGLYLLWAVRQIERPGPLGAGFDRPIARLGALGEPRLRAIEQVPPRTERERALMDELAVQTRLSARLLVLVLRVVIGSAALTGGLLLVVAALSERPLLRIIVALETAAPSSADRPC